MDWLIRHLLNIRPASWAEGGHWSLDLASLPRSDLALAAGALAIFGIWGVWWLYRREGRGLGVPIRCLLAGLRLIVLACAVGMLLEPVLVFSRDEWVPSNLIVLQDRSESMDLRDAYADAGEAQKIATTLGLPGGAAELRQRSRAELAGRVMESGLLDRLAANGDRIVRQHDFTNQLVIGPTTAPTTAPLAGATTRPSFDRSATGIGAAIRQAIAAHQGQPLAGILLVTDGQSNSGDSPIKAAEFSAADGVPIVSLAMGTAQGPRNVKIERIEVAPVVFARDPNPIRVQVESRGLMKQPATVIVERSRDGAPWEEFGRQSITLEETGRLVNVPFTFAEEQPTKLQVRARLEDVGPELSADDNTAVADVRVIRQKMRILFIAGETFPEVEFIRAALLRDAHLSASTWLQTAAPDYEQPGDPRIKRLPVTSQELDEFDCIILYDPDPALWPQEYPQMLHDFVTRAGGGLIYVAGERNTKNIFDHPDDPGSLWLNLLPVVVEPGLYHTDVSVKLSSREAWKLAVTPEGISDLIFAFTENVEEKQKVIQSLPGMFWHFPSTRARPGATVLARHGDPRMRNEHGAHVLLATQLAGPGRTFFVGFDSTYRWRYLDEHLFDGFWARMIDRAGRSKQLGGRYPYVLSVDRTSYRPGSPITLTARFENPSDRDKGVEVLNGSVEVGTESPIPITLMPKAGDALTFESTFQAIKPGVHSIRVWSGEPDAQGIVRAATIQIPVELPNLEYDQPIQDLATLQAMARISNGQAYELADASKIADAFRIKRVAHRLEDRQEIWDAPLVYGVMLTALFIEWVLRKRVRLV